MIDTGYNIKVSKALQATAMLKDQTVFPSPVEIDRGNAKGEKRMSEGDYLRMCKAARVAKDIVKAMEMNKAIVIMSRKMISRQIPDEEVGESDLPKGTMKYDEVPDAPNVLGMGGPGRVEVFCPMRGGSSAMLSNNVMGQEMLRTMSEALLRAKKEKSENQGPEPNDPSRKIKEKGNK